LIDRDDMVGENIESRRMKSTLEWSNESSNWIRYIPLSCWV